MTTPLDIVCAGGGPAGLYFALLMKKADPRHDVRVDRAQPARRHVRLRRRVLGRDRGRALAQADRRDASTRSPRHLVHWDDIDIHYRGERRDLDRPRLRGLSPAARCSTCCSDRCRAVGVELQFEREVETRSTSCATPIWSSAPTAPTARSARVARRRHSHRRSIVRPEPLRVARHDQARSRRSRSISSPTSTACGACTPTSTSTDALDLHRRGAATRPGARPASTARPRRTALAFLRAAVRRRAGRPPADHEPLASGGSFPTIRNARWRTANVVLVGDAAHTAHFSVGSGTKLAMEDAIALSTALLGTLGDASLTPHQAIALAAYERGAAARRSRACSARPRRASQWFEDDRALHALEPHPVRVHAADPQPARHARQPAACAIPEFVGRVDALVRGGAPRGRRSSHARRRAPRLPPPMFTPFRLRDLVLPNRVVVSPMCQYSPKTGRRTTGTWCISAAARSGGAGLVFAEMTDVSREERASRRGAPGSTSRSMSPRGSGSWTSCTRRVPRRSRIQLGHAGRKGATRRSWEGDNEPLAEGGWPIVAASPLPYFPDAARSRAR